MNVFQKVTLASLKKNRTRTIVTIIGVILSAAMICGVSTLVSSFQNYLLQVMIYDEGEWHGTEQNTGYETYKILSHSDEVEKAYYVQQLGYAVAEKSLNDYKPYIYLLGAGNDIQNTLPIHITEGSYPTSTQEILLPNHLYSNGGAEYQIGDTLTLELGERTKDGKILTQENELQAYEEENEVISQEKLEIRETRTYTVTGFYERPGFESYEAPGYTAITLADDVTDVSNDYLYDVYFKMKDPAKIDNFIKELGLTGGVNKALLISMGVFGNSAWGIVMSGIEIIIIGLIMFGSVTVIYNAFSISVSERTKQFGMLASVGATKKQLRGMVLFEAFVVSVIGIPLGIFAGVAGIGVTLFFVGEKFKSLGYPIKMELFVSVEAILVAVVFSTLTILISAWIPSSRATKITAIEAIRQNKDIYTNGKNIKTSKFMYRLFGFPGMIASKYFKRSKQKYRTTIVSLFMSIVLFVSASAFTDYLLESIMSGYASRGYDLELVDYQEVSGELSKNEMLEQIKAQDFVTDAACTRGYYLECEIDNSYLNEKFAQDKTEYYGTSYGDESKASMYVQIEFVNDEAFKEMLEQYGLDEETYMNPKQPLGIVVDGKINYNYVEEKSVKTDILNSDATEFHVFASKQIDGYSWDTTYVDENGNRIEQYVNESQPEKILEFPYDEVYSKYEMKAGKRIYESPYFVNSSEMLCFIYPESMRTAIFTQTEGSESPVYDYFIKSEDHAASYAALEDMLAEKDLEADLYDYAKEMENERNYITIIQVFCYGFSVLISLIAAANVFNTISTNIGLRRREFAMLKSVGMSEKGFQKMMNYECLLYGVRALLYGLPASCVATYFIYSVMDEGFVTTFRLPWGAMIIAVFSVFIVVFATMMYSMSKIKKDNPIDALRDETA